MSTSCGWDETNRWPKKAYLLQVDNVTESFQHRQMCAAQYNSLVLKKILQCKAPSVMKSSPLSNILEINEITPLCVLIQKL